MTRAIKPLVGILMGSDSDLPIMSETASTLEKFSVPFRLRCPLVKTCSDAL